MKECPISFNAPMVRALLAGTKTQTRRMVKPQPHEDRSRLEVGHYHPTVIDCHGDEQPGAEKFGAWTQDGEQGWVCPYGQPGDRLWVREAWRVEGRHTDGYSPECIGANRSHFGRIDYEASITWNKSMYGRLRPSTHMPRWASRITLEITGIRVERLQDISDDDLEQEGLQEVIDAGVDHDGYPRDAYRALWESIYGAGSWAANPWVWVVEFKRVEGGAA